MFNSTKRRSEIGRTMKSFAWTLAVLLIALVAARGAWGMYGKFVEAAQSDTNAQQQLSTLEAQQAQMSASVESLSSPRGLEAEVRERYGVAKPGEGQIQIIRDASTSTPQGVQSPNMFIRAWQALFGWL